MSVSRWCLGLPGLGLMGLLVGVAATSDWLQFLQENDKTVTFTTVEVDPVRSFSTEKTPPVHTDATVSHITPSWHHQPDSSFHNYFSTTHYWPSTMHSVDTITHEPPSRSHSFPTIVHEPESIQPPLSRSVPAR